MATAQQASVTAVQTQALPAAPSSLQNGTVSGTVTDEDGEAVGGARISFSGKQERTTMTADHGRFSFSDVPAQSFTLTVVANGFATTSVLGEVKPGEDYEEPTIVMHAGTNIDVEVTQTQEEIAEAQIKQQETQKLFAIVPNYFVSYIWHAAPLTKKQKFELAWKTTIDPVNTALNAGLAELEQLQNDFPGYGGGGSGYAKRFGAAEADFVIGTTLGGAILPSLFHQDPRYFYKGTGTIKSRALYALSTAFIARGDNGRWQPAYASMLGDMGAGAISNLYYPASSRNGASLTIENGLLSIASDAIGNVVLELILKHVTPRTPKTPVQP